MRNLTSDREADVVLEAAGTTKDRKPLFRVVPLRNVPPVVQPKADLGLVHGEKRTTYDQFHIARPSRDDSWNA